MARLSADVGAPCSTQKLLGHPCIDTGLGWQPERVNDRKDAGFRGHAIAPWASGRMTKNATTSKSLIPANSPFIACVPPGENRLATALSSLLANNRRHRASEQFLVGLHVPAEPGRLVKPSASLSIGQIAAKANLLQAIQHLLRLGVRKIDLAVVADMYDVVPGSRDSPAPRTSAPRRQRREGKK